jgi:hypothetical protein
MFLERIKAMVLKVIACVDDNGGGERQGPSASASLILSFQKKRDKDPLQEIKRDGIVFSEKR